jgi:hypothetical protein
MVRPQFVLGQGILVDESSATHFSTAYWMDETA